MRFELSSQQLMAKLFTVNINSASSLLSLSVLYAVNKLLFFLRFFSVQEDVSVRFPAPTPAAPVGSAAAEGPQADVHLAPAVPPPSG